MPQLLLPWLNGSDLFDGWDFISLMLNPLIIINPIAMVALIPNIFFLMLVSFISDINKESRLCLYWRCLSTAGIIVSLEADLVFVRK